MNSITEKIKNKIAEIEPFLIEVRRYLHQNPELSGHENNTANFILGKLREIGIESEILSTEAGPAVLGLIKINNESDTIAFRADMDALPLCEQSEKSYCSKSPGIMHACGHDLHITTVIGTAYVLANIAKELNLNIKFIFQPSEETINGGAEALIKKGIMQDVKAIFTIHAMPDLKVGKIGIKFGPSTASIDSFKVRVLGKGGHSARPHLAKDTILSACQMINMLYSDLLRQFDPVQPVVLSIGRINGGTAPNIISEKCEFEGTLRTFSPRIRKIIPEIMQDKLENLALSLGVNVDFQWSSGAPSVINDENLVILTEKSTLNLYGDGSVERFTEPSMGAEDFSRYLEHSPGILIRVGTGSEKCCQPLHTCRFDIDEKAISYGVGVLSYVAYNYSIQKVLKLKTSESDV